MNVQARSSSLRKLSSSFCLAVAFTAALALPEIALAGGGDIGEFGDKTCEFLQNITRLLNIASIAVVTIAIIFAGYQIAFAHKRISDVAPILIGGLLIGAAGQLAKWIMSDREASAECGALAVNMVSQLQHLV